VSGRSTAVLDRFPSHLSLTDPGKRFGRVAEGLVADLDVLARQVGDVRKAHRLGEGPTTLDLRRAGALHALSAPAYELVEMRADALAAVDPDDTALVSVLTNLVVDDLDGLTPDERRVGLATAVQFVGRLERGREVVRGVVAAHRSGNGTPTSLLVAVAAYLGLDLDPREIAHDDERWWHLAPAIDRLVTAIGSAAPEPDLIAIEENPFVDASITPVARRNGDRFRIRRGGLEDVLTSVVIVGTGDRTVAPMVVNVDAGRGVVYDGNVPDGAELVFEYQGRVVLGTDDVTGNAFTFAGGVFADASETHPADWVFATEGADADADPAGARRATWVVTRPIADGFDQLPSIPHGGVVNGLPLPLAESRWACFVRLAHFGNDPRAAIARNSAGRFDQSVFVGSPTDPFGSIGFRWEEREPFSVRVVLPRRLAVLDDDGGTKLREPLRALLDRHRAAGVYLSVSYADPLWDLGDGIARDPDSDEALGTVVAGTTLWPDGTPQSGPT
jgi:hypothetical protein